MKSFFLFFIAFLLYSCKEKLETTKTDIVKVDNNSLRNYNSTYPHPEYLCNRDSVEQFLFISYLLENPLDLNAYKKKKGEANSGGGKSDILYKPNYKGLYLSYFLFPNLYEASPHLTVYRKGTVIGGFYEDRDELVQIFAEFSDPDLGNLNLIGKNIIEIECLLGKPNFAFENYIFYSRDNQLLMLFMKNNRVNWFKWSKLKNGIQTIDDIPLEIWDRKNR